MPRRVFLSFHYAMDFWRAQQVRNINALAGQAVASLNEWETVKRGGEAAIERWIATEMAGKTCVVVLVGAQTASRPWVQHEIVKGWNDGKGVLGVRVHKLLGTDSQPSHAGPNPFARITLKKGTISLADIAPLRDPVGSSGKAAYATIVDSIESWIEDAIRVRAAQ